MNEKPTVAVLFTHARTHYRELPNVEIYDRRRDARSFRGGIPVVAHPPCRAFSRYLRKQAKPEPHEKTLAYFALACVRAYGGVLEHPRLSTLFDECAIPKPNDPPDKWGYTIEIWQWWWGYPGGKKRTWLYICGVPMDRLPMIPFRLWTPGDYERWRHLSRSARCATPIALCEWLVAVARAAGDHSPTTQTPLLANT